MITGFLTFVFFFAIVGCVLYGRKLIKTEKVDAVLVILNELKVDYTG